nr:MAG TPA: hypothetical protein [Caudoviricetes sp.]
MHRKRIKFEKENIPITFLLHLYCISFFAKAQ